MMTYGRKMGKSYLGSAIAKTFSARKYLPPGSYQFSGQYQMQPTGTVKHTTSQHSMGLAMDFKVLSDLVQGVGVSLAGLAASFTVQFKAYEEVVAKYLADYVKEQEELTTPPQRTGAPDIAGTVVGYRVWEVSQGRRGLGLYAVAQNYTWQSGRNEAKLCPNDCEEEPHPYPWCMCGFWAMYDPVDVPYGPFLKWQYAEYAEITAYGDAMSRYIPSRPAGWEGYILGRIEGWGVVVEAEAGFRAQYAKITELYYPGPEGKDFIHSLGVAYGVPVLEPDFDYNYD